MYYDQTVPLAKRITNLQDASANPSLGAADKTYAKYMAGKLAAYSAQQGVEYRANYAKQQAAAKPAPSIMNLWGLI